VSIETSLKMIYRAYARDPAFHRLRTDPPQPKRVVPGRGSLNPRVVLVGEAPGRAEAATRKPFMGAAGTVLNGLLAYVGLTRADVFVTNVVKYRPTIGQISVRNRTPSWPEIAASRPYLINELDLFPGVPVITLGNTPLRAVGADPFARISSVHGRGSYDAYRLYVHLYHPAVAVYDAAMMETLLTDMDTVQELLEPRS
jgi:uracil-DNA glycosylase family 4